MIYYETGLPSISNTKPYPEDYYDLYDIGYMRGEMVKISSPKGKMDKLISLQS